jgi:hypothetical protein
MSLQTLSTWPSTSFRFTVSMPKGDVIDADSDAAR